MSRWAEMFVALSRGHDTADTIDTTPPRDRSPPYWVNRVDCVRRVEREISAPAPASSEQPAVDPADDPDERAAIIEEGAGVPRRWAEGFAAYAPCRPQPGFRRNAGNVSSMRPAPSSTNGPPRRSNAAGTTSTCSAATQMRQPTASMRWAL
jgi:hypothetical protein